MDLIILLDKFVILRQIINFAVATFAFMAGYFVNVDDLSDKEFSYKHWIIYRGGGRLCIPFIIWCCCIVDLSY